MREYSIFVVGVVGTVCTILAVTMMLTQPPNPIARIMGEPVVPLSVKVAAIGLLATGLLIGFVAGIVTGWCARERR